MLNFGVAIRKIFNHSIYFYLLFLAFAYFPLFHHIGNFVVRFWDEGQNAVNAFEMIQRNSWLIKYYDGKPDFWETKPPFFVWHLIVSMKLFGYSELALRLPSALYTLLGCFLMIRFSDKFLKNKYIGFVAGLVIVTSLGVVGRHNARTGDTDATLVFYLLLSTLSFFQFLHSPEHKKKYFWIFSTSLFIAFFTKSVIGGLLLPGMFFYALYAKKIKYIFCFRDFYIALPLFLLLIGAYYWYHEVQTPGYLHSLIDGELGGRYTDETSGFSNFYILNFWNWRFSKWLFAVPLALSLALWFGKSKIKNFSLYLVFIIVVTLAVLSNGSKNLWYDAPLYPLMALIIGIGFCEIWRFLRSFSIKKYVLPIFLLFFLVHVGFAYQEVLKKTLNPQVPSYHKEWYGCSTYLRDAVDNSKSLGNLNVLFDGYPSAVLFYVHVLNLERGNDVRLANWTTLHVGDELLVAQSKVKENLDTRYQMELIDSVDLACRFRIVAPYVD